MRDEEERGALRAADLADALEALALEVGVADAENLVDDQEVGHEHGRGGEHQPHVHAGRIGLGRLVDVLLKLGEVDHVADHPLRLRAGDSEVREVGRNVLPTRELRVEARAEGQQRLRVAVDFERARCRLDDLGDQAQERALAGAVAPDDRDLLARAGCRA